MQNSIFSPQQLIELGNQNCQPKTRSVSQTVGHGSTGTVDYKILDDSILMGLQLITQNALFGDSFTISVIDIDNVLGLGANHVVGSPVNSWICSSVDGVQFDEDVAYPTRTLPTGLYIRCSFTSTAGALGQNVSVAVNYKLHEVLF